MARKDRKLTITGKGKGFLFGIDSAITFEDSRGRRIHVKIDDDCLKISCDHFALVLPVSGNTILIRNTEHQETQ